MLRHTALLLCCPVVLALPSIVRATDDVPGGALLLVNDNAGWSWYQDERVIADPAAGSLLVGSVANTSGAGGSGRAGNVDLSTLDLSSRTFSRVTLAGIQADDHNTPALMVRPDGRYLAVYANHNADALTRYRVSTNPHDTTSWSPEQTFTNPASATYSNVFRLSSTGVTYDFTRTVGWDPNVLTSTDDGSTWSYAGRLLRDPADSNSYRPYVKYASNNTDRIDFIATESHPRESNTGVYHGYLRDGNLYTSDGTLVGPLGSVPPANAFTPLLLPNQVVDGTTRTNGWTTDLGLDASGNPYALFTSRVAGSTDDHRLYYAHYTGSSWQVTELAKMGAGLYSSENDYTGLGALDPRNPSTVYISTDINPATSVTTPKHEIYKGTSTDNGATWSWTPITQNSTQDNLRPVIPSWSDGTAVFWMRGKYTSYTNYDMAVVGLVTQDGESAGKIHYTDATPANTSLAADGTPLSTLNVTAGTGPGPTDGKWHVRSGFGNGGSVLTSGESGNEDAPTLRTTLTDVPAGTYDVYALFFANPNEDWQISAGLSADSLRVYEQDFSAQAAAGDFDSAVTLTGSTVNLYKAYLGRVTLTAAGDLPIFVDDSPYATTIQQRTWYDGVGLAPVTVPEPATALVLAAAASPLLRRPRHRLQAE